MSDPRTCGGGWAYPAPSRPVQPPPPPPTPAWGWQLPPPPPRGPRRSWGLGVGIAVSAVIVALAVAAGSVLVTRVLLTPQTLRTAGSAVSVQVPRSWLDDTSDDAGEPYTGADPDDTYVVPDLEAEDGDGDTQLSIWISPTTDGFLQEQHRDLVASTCEEERCLTRGVAVPTTVAGRPAIRQLLTHPADPDWGRSSSLVVTIDRGTDVIVSVVVWTDEYADTDVDALLATLTLGG